MARVSSPLFSKSASGSVSDVLTFSKRNSGQQVRFQKKQKDVSTVERVEQRGKFFNASLACRFMLYGEAYLGISFFGVTKDFFTDEATDIPMTGYNLCISQHLI